MLDGSGTGWKAIDEMVLNPDEKVAICVPSGANPKKTSPL
jgi:hypothetical protein